jgi:CheY-like chemotaxis protein
LQSQRNVGDEESGVCGRKAARFAAVLALPALSRALQANFSDTGHAARCDTRNNSTPRGIVMDETRILTVDDHRLFREGLCRLLETTPGFRVVGQCATAAEALVALRKTPTDVILLDSDLDEERGSSLLTELKKRRHEVKVLMVTAGMTLSFRQACVVKNLD